MEVRDGDQTSVWLYGLPKDYSEPCWVNAKLIQLDGDISSLEPNYYPDKAPPKIFSTDLFPAPKEIEASRSGDQVEITWVGFDPGLGDRESPNSPRYLVETWTCQNNQIVFMPQGVFNEYAVVRDEAGCSEPSHGRVFLAHRDGYIGPSEITPWPEYPTSTPTP